MQVFQNEESAFCLHADMAELADALDLGSSVHDVQVQVLLSALKSITHKIKVLYFFYWEKQEYTNRHADTSTVF